MSDNGNHDRILCKIQHFADMMVQRKLEKEALSIAIDDKSLKSEIRSEILIYQQILDEYYEIFKEILSR